MQVQDAMSTEVVWVVPEDCAWLAAELLTQRALTGLPVVNAERQVTGVISEVDVIQALRQGKDLRATTVAEVMNSRPLFVEPETDLDTVFGLMEEWRVRRLPVSRNGRIVGVISRGDVLRALLLQRLQRRATPAEPDPRSDHVSTGA